MDKFCFLWKCYRIYGKLTKVSCVLPIRSMSIVCNRKKITHTQRKGERNNLNGNWTTFLIIITLLESTLFHFVVFLMRNHVRCLKFNTIISMYTTSQDIRYLWCSHQNALGFQRMLLLIWPLTSQVWSHSVKFETVGGYNNTLRTDS